MLIVIVIIGILAAALIPRLQSVQGRARDAQRKSDLNQVNTAMLVRFSDVGSYPASVGSWYTWNVAFLMLTGYMTTVPIDPLIDYITNHREYEYRRKDYTNISYPCFASNLQGATKYAFYTKLENPTLADSGTFTDGFDACPKGYRGMNYRLGN